MASVNDPTGYREKFERELKLVGERLDEDVAGILRQWGEGMTTEFSTRSNHLAHVRRLAEYADVSLLEMTESQFYELHASLRDGTADGVKDDGLAPGTLRAMRSSARM
ncbi:MAG: hypothetical protein ABEH59_13005, partial [Halobacteriales archaeon]